jgi:hypothetical protein
MDFNIPELSLPEDPGIPGIQRFNEALFGAGSSQIKMDSSGFFVGGDSFEDASYSQDYSGKISIKDSSGNIVILIDPNG